MKSLIFFITDNNIILIHGYIPVAESYYLSEFISWRTGETDQEFRRVRELLSGRLP